MKSLLSNQVVRRKSAYEQRLELARSIKKDFAVAKVPTSPSTTDFLGDWAIFLKRNFGFEPNLGEIIIPQAQPGFESLVIMPKGMNLHWIRESIIMARIRVWLFCGDFKLLEESVSSVRSSRDGSYAIRVRSSIESDYTLVDKSTLDLEFLSINTMTIEERLIFDLFLRSKGMMLDRVGLTLCSASKLKRGGTLTVCSGIRGEIYIDLASENTKSSGPLSAREVITA